MTSYRDRHLAGTYTAPKTKPKNTGSSKTTPKKNNSKK